jgi:uncharacterized membrane protein YvbJ
MPLRKKNATRNKIIFWTIAAIILALMIISFPPLRHTTEVVLF